MLNKIKIAVSSCLLGEAVRYDGTDKYIQMITEHLANKYNLISLCPEMAVGMGVPRPPIHLIDVGNHQIEVVGVDNPENNMTKPLFDYGLKVLDLHTDICGYIFKKNSPSCGIQNVKVMQTDGEYKRYGQGIYVAAIMKYRPLLPIIDEDNFLDESLRDEFLNQVKKYYKGR